MDLELRQRGLEFRMIHSQELERELELALDVGSRFDRVRPGRYRHIQSIETIDDLGTDLEHVDRHRWQCMIHRGR